VLRVCGGRGVITTTLLFHLVCLLLLINLLLFFLLFLFVLCPLLPLQLLLVQLPAASCQELLETLSITSELMGRGPLAAGDAA
jgi:hypothetical protein